MEFNFSFWWFAGQNFWFAFLGTSAFFLIPCFSICSSIYLIFWFASSEVVFFLKNGFTTSYFSFGELSDTAGLFAIFIPFSFVDFMADRSDKLSKFDTWLWISEKNTIWEVFSEGMEEKSLFFFLLNGLLLPFGLMVLSA